MTYKFNTGDLVIYEYGAYKAQVKLGNEHSFFKGCWGIESYSTIEGSAEGTEDYFFSGLLMEEYIIPKEIWDSPLYKVMKED